MGDSHQMVIDYIGKIIRWVSIRLDQYHIVQLGVVHGDVTVNLIVERGSSLGWIILADDVRHAGCQIGLHFFPG